ncbi:SPOR domain-containing protein [Ferrimonas sp. YFM]|uniref:SPOR domain-containing protein n=1 Tax=Ferrimonas sp. YFM TaxID=3028878 RepID=UPI0025726439|nr:SPOR domain-containing protein [Ferrimonas sp. YFM]BDY06788.1 cell division protein FtsN [Ferrimonas sp. YFM]
MATRDYAKRGRKPRSRGRKAAPKASFPWVRLVVVLALIAGFGYFLWSIQGASDEAPEPQPATEVVKPKPQPKTEPALPEKPKETWEYIETLPEKQVEVEVPKQELKGPYQMQCGSFRTRDQADAMKARIAFMGLESEIRRTEGSNGVWYRVRLGPYERKRLAESDRHALQRGGINTCQIWLWN